MHTWESIQKTLDYIEQNLGQNIQTEELAKHCGLSVFYYQRLFSRLVKKPLHEYIKLRRLAKACDQLKNPAFRILDVAVECGFSSHELFTRSFKDAYGITPEQYRADPVMMNHFDQPDLSLSYTIADEGIPLIRDNLVLEMNRRKLEQPITFLGCCGYIPIAKQLPLGENTSIDLPANVWEQFHRTKDLIDRVPNGRELGVSYLGDAPEGYFTYFCGSETDHTRCDGQFIAYQLPAREYIVCSFEAESREQLITTALNKAVKYCGLWLQNHRLKMELYSPEIYYPAKKDISYMELWLPYVEENN